jgi:hypothetical protein
MDTPLAQNVSIGATEAQVKNSDGIPFRSLHRFGHTHSRCMHAGVVNGKTI